MPIFYVAELHEGLIQDPQIVLAPKTNGWRFFAHCNTDDIESCSLIYKDFLDLTDKGKKLFTDLWNYLWEAGKAGKPWNHIFQNGKLFHPIHSFNVKRTDPATGKTKLHQCEVHQFKKKATGIRVLFVYTDTCLVAFVTHAFEKNSQETPSKEKTRAEVLAQAFFDAIDSKTIQLITAQGGKNETRKLFYD